MASPLLSLTPERTFAAAGVAARWPCQFGEARGERFCVWPRMIEWRPDLLVVFAGGKGTADMVRRARAAGVEVIEP